MKCLLRKQRVGERPTLVRQAHDEVAARTARQRFLLQFQHVYKPICVSLNPSLDIFDLRSFRCPYLVFIFKSMCAPIFIDFRFPPTLNQWRSLPCVQMGLFSMYSAGLKLPSAVQTSTPHQCAHKRLHKAGCDRQNNQWEYYGCLFPIRSRF